MLRRFTQARIGLGRCGSGLPTAALLEFQLAHAQARDAVHVPWDLGRFAEEVRGLGMETVVVETAVSDRGEYLRRPDLGRRLTQRSRERLAGLASPMDVILIVTNGLSSTAVERHGLPLLSAVLAALGPGTSTSDPWCWRRTGAWRSPTRWARPSLHARRPSSWASARGCPPPIAWGLSDLRSAPRHHRRTAQLHLERTPARGLGYEAAAAKLGYLAAEALRRGVSGVALKDEGGVEALGYRP